MRWQGEDGGGGGFITACRVAGLSNQEKERENGIVKTLDRARNATLCTDMRRKTEIGLCAGASGSSCNLPCVFLSCL